MVARERGFTFMELCCAMAVFIVIATGAVVGGRAHFTLIGQSFDRTVAERQAASRLEQVGSAATLAEGESEFEAATPALPAARGLQTVRMLEPGLYEVTVRVQWREGVKPVELTTLMAREAAR